MQFAALIMQVEQLILHGLQLESLGSSKNPSRQAHGGVRLRLLPLQVMQFSELLTQVAHREWQG